MSGVVVGGNQAQGGASGEGGTGGAAGQGVGGGLYLASGSLTTLKATIVAGNYASTGANNIYGTYST